MFDEELHKKKPNKELNIACLPKHVRKLVQDLVIKYWSVIADTGFFVHVKYYKCIINTGGAQPLSVLKINYGPHETLTMHKCIAALY